MLEPSFMRFTRDENKVLNKATRRQVDYIRNSFYTISERELEELTIDEAFDIIKEIEDFYLEIEAEYYAEDIGDR